MQLLSLLFGSAALKGAIPGTVFLSGSLIDLDATVFIQFVLFFLAFFILKALVFKPVIALIEAREEAIEGAVEEAKAMTVEAKAAEEEFETEMQTVRRTAAAERDKLRAEGKKLETTVLDKVRSETAAQLAAAEETLAKEARKVRSEMEAQTPILAKQIASKLLQRDVA